MILYSEKSHVQNLLKNLSNLSAGDDNAQMAPASITEYINNLAVVMVSGDIVQHSGLSVIGQAQNGVCDLDTINSAINTLQSDDTISTVLFWFDTCGGGSNGLYNSWNAINALSQTKLCVAFCDSNMCSAGYLLASACQIIVSTPDSMVGAIGCVTTVNNDPNAKVISSGVYKAALNGEAKTTEQEDYLQNLVNQELEHFWEVANVKRTLNDELKKGGAYRFDDQTKLGLVEFQVNNFKDVALSLL